MSSFDRKDLTSTLITAGIAIAVSSSLLTYSLTRKKIKSELESKQAKFEALKRFASDRNLKAVEKLSQTAAAAKDGGFEKPLGTKIPNLGIDDVYLWKVEHLSDRFESEAKNITNAMHGMKKKDVDTPTFFDVDKNQRKRTEYNKLIGTHECILADLVRKPGQKAVSKAYVRAGARQQLHFCPDKVNAAIVTCGGICPGLNNVVREITNSLYHLYDIKGKVWGVRGGYKGFYDPLHSPMELTPEVVENIHHEGGTILASSRGGFDLDKILAFLEKYKISQLYVIGGDGTHRGAFRVHEECIAKGLNVSIAGIPKTIDNDVDYIDRSFGFVSAVEAAQNAIRVAKTEATCNLPNGIGIVKLMGRSAGYIAVHATLGSGDVDLCLVPEIPIVLEGENGCLPHLMRRVKEKGYAVVVVAEGAGEEILGASAETDKSGNKILPKIGEFLKKATEKYFRDNGNEATIKYIDPSYLIRSVPANAEDSLYCLQLGQNAVHGAMAGFTGFSVGLCNNKMVLLPIPELVSTSPRMMNPRGRTWERVLSLTRQPNTVISRESF